MEEREQIERFEIEGIGTVGHEMPPVFKMILMYIACGTLLFLGLACLLGLR